MSASVSAWLVVVSALPAASKAEADGHQIMLRVPTVVTVVPVVLPQAKAGQPLIDRMAVAARLAGLSQAGDSSTVLFVTTSDKPGGVNRLELVET